MERIARSVLPSDVSFEWTAMSYQENVTGDTLIYVFALSLLLVYLCLAGQYESWILPLSVLAAVPLALVGPVLALSAVGAANNLYVQIGLMLLIFFNTGGITGAEGGVAAGTVVLAQRLLESVFGDEAVRRLAETAKQDLDARVEGLMASELARFTAVLDRLPIDAQRAEEICQAVAQVSRDRQIDAAGQVVAAQADLPELSSGATTAIASDATRVELTTVSPSPTAEVVEAELVPDEGAGR